MQRLSPIELRQCPSRLTDSQIRHIVTTGYYIYIYIYDHGVLSSDITFISSVTKFDRILKQTKLEEACTEITCHLKTLIPSLFSCQVDYKYYQPDYYSLCVVFTHRS